MDTQDIRRNLMLAAVALKTATAQMAKLSEVRMQSYDNGYEMALLDEVMEDIYGDHFDDAIAKLKGEHDPTPWCAVCGAKTQKACGCDR